MNEHYTLHELTKPKKYKKELTDLQNGLFSSGAMIFKLMENKDFFDKSLTVFGNGTMYKIDPSLGID